MGARPPALSRVWYELRRRKVIRAAGIYAGAAVAVSAAANEWLPRLLLPDWTVTFVVVLVLLGFPIALALAWVYELRPDAEPGDVAPRAPASPAGIPQTAAAPAPAFTATVAAIPVAAPATSPAEAMLRPDERPGIVVLPFDNLSPDADDAYFASGLTEEITSDLSALSGLRVISRTSATQLKASGREVRSFARELGIGYLLEGSVRKAGERIRVTAQLIDTAGDVHLWSRNYDGTLTDVFAIQESVARAIAEALRLHLTPGEERSLSEAPVTDLRAYERYLRARDQIHRFTVEALDRAVEYLERARGEVGDRPAILSGLAYAYCQYVNLGLEQESYIERAEDYARRALVLDPDSSEARVVLAFVELWFRGNPIAALEHLGRAVAARPDDAHALLWLSVARAQVGEVEGGRAAARRLLEVDPLTPSNQVVPSTIELYAGRFEEALQGMKRAFRAEPENPMVQMFFAVALFFAGHHEALRRFVADHAEGEAGPTVTVMLRLLGGAAEQNAGAMRALLDPPSTRATFRRDAQLSWFTASAFACAEDLDSALDWIGNAVERGLLNTAMLTDHDPFLGPLRNDSRFDEIVRRAHSILEAARARGAGA